MLLMATIAFCATFKTSNTYVSNKSTSTVTLTSSTLNFAINTIKLYSVGDYTIMTSSFSNTTNEKFYVPAGIPYTYDLTENPIKMTGTGALITLNLQAGTTVYYTFEGVK